jgi:hypothetical protein
VQAAVRKVTSVREAGPINPQTVCGSIVVDGVLRGVYTSAVAPDVAHAALGPRRGSRAVTLCSGGRVRKRQGPGKQHSKRALALSAHRGALVCGVQGLGRSGESGEGRGVP